MKKKNKNMRKSKTVTMIIFLPLRSYIEKVIFCYKTYLEKRSSFFYICMSFFHVNGYWKCSNNIPTYIQIHTGFVDIVLRPKILGNRLRNCFSNYGYLKVMCIILKGIRKILFVSVLRIVIFCNFLNFTKFLCIYIPEIHGAS